MTREVTRSQAEEDFKDKKKIQLTQQNSAVLVPHLLEIEIHNSYCSTGMNYI